MPCASRGLKYVPLIHEYIPVFARVPDNICFGFIYLFQNPVSVIQKLNDFMETGCSEELIEQIADVTNFAKMKQAKAETELKAYRMIAMVSFLQPYHTIAITS